jgi:DUF1365 family protein
MKSCIYEGTIGHSRLQPVVNRFSYSIFMMYLDLSELGVVFKGRAFWSVGRPNLAWFRRRDYLGNPDVALDAEVRNLIETKVGKRPEGPIRMLTHLRYLGHNFNPVTFYYAFDPAGKGVDAIVANITNTPWSERYSYVMEVNNGSDNEMHFRFEKNFHVSPFIDMDMEYDWRFSHPGETVHIRMTNFREEIPIFRAYLDMKRLELSGGNLARMLLTHPPMTMKVIAGIYWQALKLRMKGATFYPHPEYKNEKPSR